MANRYANLNGSKKISEDFGNINIGFDRVQLDVDSGVSATNQLKTRVDNIVADAGSSNTEIVDARLNQANETAYTTLKERLDSDSLIITGTWVNVKKYGAKGDGTTDDTASIQSTINDALVTGADSIFFPPGTYNVQLSSLVNVAGILFVGNGAIFTDENGQKIANVGRGQGAVIFARALNSISSMIPLASLQRVREAILNGSIKIAYWGDSITEGLWDTTDYAMSYAKRLEREIVNALPNVTVTVFNYAIAGHAFGQAMDPAYIPYNVRPWADVPGKAWRDYVKDFEPDLLIIAFGMNDSFGAGADNWEATNWQTLLTYTATWSKQPSIVAVSTMLPTIDTAKFNQSQKSTIAVARTTREFAKNNGIALADVNRLFRILRDGKDDVSRIGYMETAFQGYNTSKWSGDKSSFTLNAGVLTPATTTNKFVTRNRNFYNGVIEVDITPSGEGFGYTGWINYRKDIDLGNMTVLVIPGGSTTGQIDLYSNFTKIVGSGFVNIPANIASTIRIEVDGANHSVYLNGTNVIDFTTYERLHDGNIKFGSDQQPPKFSNLKMTYYDSVTTEPMFTEKELLGPYNDAGTSGNGQNHPSDLGHALFYLPAFDGVVKSLTLFPKDIKETVMLENGWLNYGSPFATAGYYKDESGFIHPTGLIKSGTTTAGTVVFTLPEGARPTEQIIKHAGSSNGSATSQATLWIYTDGRVTIESVVGNTWLSLDDIKSFRCAVE